MAMELLENASSPKAFQPLNIKKEVRKYLRHWPWFLLSMALFYAAAKIYLRYTEPQYFSTTSLKLQETKGNSTAALSDLKTLGVGISGDTELQGETTIVVSKPILKEVAKNLDLTVSFYSVGTIKETELYNDAPVTGKIISLDQPNSFSSATFTLSPVGKNSYKLDNSNKVYRYGSTVKLSFGTVRLDAKPGLQAQAPLKVVFRSLGQAVANLENRITVTLPPEKGLLMDLSYVGPTPQKSEDILNELSKQYILDGINDKNQEALNTQNFINDRLAIITDDLSGIEGQKEAFKRTNQITDLEAQAGIALTNAEENTKAILTNTMQLELINSVLAASAGNQLIPSGMGLPGGAESAISQYNDLVINRNRVLKQATPENPAVIQMNKQIATLKNLIRQNLLESRETLQLQIAQARGQLNIAKGNISKFPTQEKKFRSIDRQQNLKEQLYLYLLQKREENAITLAVTAPKAKIVNPAYTTGVVKPNSKQIIYGALAAGFLLPLLFFVGAQVLDTKVHSKQQIVAQLPEASVLAEIPFYGHPVSVVQANDFSVFAESFRILASNLKYLLKAKEQKDGAVILITSSVKGEGKTTISMNLAQTLAGKNKVIIVGADIRNPQLHRFIEGENKGITDYLVSESNDIAEYIKPSGLSTNLQVLFSGPIAPNPNDLLDMNKFDDLIEQLKKQYDYIVLDSAPVMLVSDTLHLVENSDVVLYVVKADFTEKEMVTFADGFQKENGIKNMTFVVNGVKPENTRYGKKYGYGYYSYTHEEEQKWWKKWI
jgi:capsular exopolysaccharide synthesis family protein